MELALTGREVISMTEPIDLSRLSVADEVSEDEDDDTEETSLLPSQNFVLTAQPVQITVPTRPIDTSTQRVKSVIRNLNFLASRSVLEELPQNTVEATPFWSPDPQEDINVESKTSQPTQNRVRSSSSHEVVSLDEDDDEEDEWELINADLEKSFVDSFPSASKRAGHIQPATQVQASSDFDFEDEDGEYVLPSIEKDHSYNDEISYSRRKFLRGLTQYAASMTPPVLETPSKMPRNPIASRILKPDNDGAIFNIRSQQAVTRTPKFQPYQSYAIAKPARTYNSISERPGLARVIPHNDRGSHSTTTNLNTSTSNLNSGWPGTTIRTKVPVIVRKKIVDY